MKRCHYDSNRVCYSYTIGCDGCNYQPNSVRNTASMFLAIKSIEQHLGNDNIGDEKSKLGISESHIKNKAEC